MAHNAPPADESARMAQHDAAMGKEPSFSSNLPNSMLENASTEELSGLVLILQDEYAKLSKDKRSADETIATLSRQYKGAMEEIGNLSSRVRGLEAENEEVEAETERLHEDLALALRDAERARVEATMQGEEAERKLKETEKIFGDEMEEARHKFEVERKVVDQQKAQITKEKASADETIAAIDRRYKDAMDEIGSLSSRVHGLEAAKEEAEAKNSRLQEDLTLALRDAKRVRLEGTMGGEEVERKLRETEKSLAADLEEARKKFEMERKVVNQQKAQIAKEKASADETIAAIDRQYKDAMDKIGILSSRVYSLETEKKEVEAKNMKLQEDLALALRDANRAILEGTMGGEEAERKFREIEESMGAELEELRHKFEMERKVVDQQKVQIAKEKASADETIAAIDQQYKDAMNEIGNLSSRVHGLKAENARLQEDQMQALQDAERARVEGKRKEELERKLRETEQSLGAKLEEVRHKFEVERNVVNQQKAQIAKDKASAYETITTLDRQYKDAMDNLGRLSSRLHGLEAKNEEFKAEKARLNEDLTLARRDAQRARDEGTMRGEETERKLREVEKSLGAELEEAIHKIKVERNVVDQQKAQIDNLKSKLETHQEDSEAAAKSYETAISKLKTRLKKLQSETTREARDVDGLRVERDRLREEREELAKRAEHAQRAVRQLDKDLKDARKDLDTTRKDLDATRKEYESRISGLKGEANRVRGDYESKLNGMTDERAGRRDRAVRLERELVDARKEVEALEGEVADLTEMVEAMEKNMAAVRSDFATRTETAREEAITQQEEYKERLVKLQGELDTMRKKSREALYRNGYEARDKIHELEQALVLKSAMLDQAEKEQHSVREMYEGRIDRMKTEVQNSKEEHTREIELICKLACGSFTK